MKKRFAASAMILAMSAATVLSPLTAFAEAEEQELNIAIFQGGYGDAYWNQMVELFEESHEGVKVNMTISPTIGDIIRPQIVAGNAPDFICLNDGGEDGVILSLIKDHALLNLDDVFDGENYAGTGTLRDDITDGILSSTKCAPYGDDEIYLAPFNSGPQGLIYNKTFFDENNLEVPKTWDEFFALGEQAKEDGIALFTYPQPGYFDATMYQMLAQAGGMEFYNKAVNYDANTWTSAEGKQVIDTIAKLASPEYLWSDTVANANADGGFKINQQAVIDNKALFMPNGNWVIGEMANSTPEGFNWGMMAPPKFTADQENYIYTFTEQMWVPAEAPNMELAKEFIKFMYSDEVVDLMLANKVENKETGEKVATPIVSPVLGASDKLEDGVVKDTYTLASSEGYNAVAGTWATTKAIDGFDMKGTVYGAIDALNTGDLTADAYQQQLIDAWTKCLENLQ